MKRMMLIAAIAAAALPIARAADAPVPFADLSGSSDKPINVHADSQQADFNAQTATYIGNVRIEQGEMVLRADQVVALVPKGKITLVTATGHVVVTSNDATAEAPAMIYDLTVRTIKMSGGVVLTQGGNTMKGTDLFVDLAKGTAELTSTGGRVEGVFQPSAKGGDKPKT